MSKTRRLLLTLFFALSFSVTANIPAPLQQPPEGDLQLAEVMANTPHLFDGSTIRWGGTLLSIHNIQGGVQLALVERPLDETGKPIQGTTAGRFIVQHNQTLDRKRYSRGQLLTVSGTIIGSQKTQVGNRMLDIPIIQLKQHHLWGKEYRHFKKKSATDHRALTRHHDHPRHQPLHQYPGVIVSGRGIYIHPNSGLSLHHHRHRHRRYSDAYGRPYCP